MRNKRHYLILALCLVSMLLSACHLQRKHDEEVASEKTVTTITFLNAMHGAQQQALNKMVKTFNNSQQQYRVISEPVRDYYAVDQKIYRLLRKYPTLMCQVMLMISY